MSESISARTGPRRRPSVIACFRIVRSVFPCKSNPRLSVGCSGSDPEDVPRIAWLQVRFVEGENLRNGRVPPEMFGNGHVNLQDLCRRGRKEIGQSGGYRLVVRHRGPRPEEPKHQVGALRWRKIAKPVDPAVFPNPVSGAHGVAVFRLVIARLNGLLRREETRTAARRSRKGFGSLLSASSICIMPEILTGCMRLCPKPSAFPSFHAPRSGRVPNVF